MALEKYSMAIEFRDVDRFSKRNKKKINVCVFCTFETVKLLVVCIYDLYSIKNNFEIVNNIRNLKNIKGIKNFYLNDLFNKIDIVAMYRFIYLLFKKYRHSLNVVTNIIFLTLKY